MDDAGRIAEIARSHFVANAAKSLGRQGTDALRILLPKVIEISECIDYESINTSLIVFYVYNPDVACLDYANAYEIEDVAELALHNEGVLTVEVRRDGSLAVWKTILDDSCFAQGSLSYHFNAADGESFLVDAVSGSIPPPLSYARIFATSRFKDLENSLHHYAIRLARNSECQILAGLWREEARIMWTPAPESDMRVSLYQYLAGSLRQGNPDVTQETNVDSKNPVDIQVKWANSNKVALIEVKWLGCSGALADSTSGKAARITDRHGEVDATDGLVQLVNYLDLTRSRAGTYDRRGFLFIYDARRKNVGPGTASLSTEHALAFKDAHIVFDQDLLARHDVAKPIRCFCEPLLQSGASPSKVGRQKRHPAGAS